MADAAGLSLTIGAVLKGLFDYSQSVKSAQREITELRDELSALKSVLDMHVQYATRHSRLEDGELQQMLRTAQNVIEGLASMAAERSSREQRTVQSLKWPLQKAGIREKLHKIERLKSWFLMDVVVHSNLSSDAIRKDMKAVSESFRREAESLKHHQASEAESKLKSIVAPVSPDMIHSKACQVWKGTESGLWFCDGPLKQFVLDSASTSQVLVLTGKSGAGKTTLLSRAIEHVRRDLSDNASHDIAYFYCAYNEVDSQTARNVLGSWVSQIPSALSKLQKRIRKPEQASVEELENALISVANTGSILLFLDAINESPDGAQELSNCIVNLLKGAPAIKCVVSTTPYLRAVKKIVNLSCRHISMSPQATMPDMEAYIKSRVAANDVLTKIPVVEYLNALLPKSEGMFRWVDCQIAYLSGQLTPRLVRRALNTLPGTLDETYAALLARIPRPARRIVRDGLLWLSFCHRLLRIDELCEAVILEDDERDVEDSCRLQDPEEVSLIVRRSYHTR